MKKTKQQNQRNHQITEYELEEAQVEKEIVPHQPLIRKPIWVSTLVLIVIAIVGGFFTTTFEDEGTAEEVVANRVSTATEAGEDLFEDESNADIAAGDFEVTNAGTDGGEARMLIWDYNSEDFDEVAIFVDGAPVKEKLILSNNAAAISIPVPSVVTVSGVKDTGGGISYAVKFPNTETTYFNVVAVGQSNAYTVLPKP
jgi:hypothetical protein